MMSSRTSGVAVAVNAAIGGRRPARSLAWHSAAAAQTPIIGTEIVAPLGDAVRLVDHEPRDRQLVEQPQELIRRESFRRHIQQPQAAGARGAQHVYRPSVVSIECSAPDRIPRRFSSST